MTKKLWGGRFQKRTDLQFESFSASFKWDKRLLPYDLKIDRAHVKALRKCGVLSSGEEKRFLNGIQALERKYQTGSLPSDGSFEDVHSFVQSELQKWLGPLADKLHAGRSRNDLVSQSSRLYCKDHAARILGQVRGLQRAIVVQAQRNEAVLLPGMTHMQNAQVLSQGHIFLAYAEMLERVVWRLKGALPFFDVCVLGSGALAGVTFSLDQKLIAKELGLSEITRNSYDAAGDRDFLLNFLSCVLFLGLQISRISEDLMIAQTKGFSIVDVDQAFCTGSSMMPQKKNADFLELTRGSVGVFAGNFLGFAATLKGLPTSYNRDLQWDKKYVFDSVETCEEILLLFTRMIQTLKINRAKAKLLLADESLFATDLADFLVGKGVPFKEAHEQAGRIVAFAENKNLPISKIGLDLLRKFAPKLDGGVYALFSPEHSVHMKKTIGSTHPAEIKKQIAVWKKKLKEGK